MSMNPGARTRPLASRTFSNLEGLKFPIFVMREPVMRRLALRRGAPVPSASWALRMTRDWGPFWAEIARGKKQKKRTRDFRNMSAPGPRGYTEIGLWLRSFAHLLGRAQDDKFLLLRFEVECGADYSGTAASSRRSPKRADLKIGHYAEGF